MCLYRLEAGRGSGTVVWVLGPGGDRHYYAHLEVADIHSGQRVLPGDVLGASKPDRSDQYPLRC